MNGKLVIFEGPDGVGKTTFSKILAQKLSLDNINNQYYSFPGKQKGTLGGLIYKIHHNSLKIINNINPTSLQLLHVASHIDILNLLSSFYNSGGVVILDRFWWSTFVYGKSMGVNEQILKKMIEIETYYWNGINPDIVFLIERENKNDKNKVLMDIYDSLAGIEKNKYNIMKINNSSISTTSSKILDTVNELIHK